MCGIIAYSGKKQALPILLDGLRRLEYRGYDSAGVAVGGPQAPDLGPRTITRHRSVGNIQSLCTAIGDKKIVGSIGIAHTRWATHGGVTEVNAHPHAALDGKLVLVHNGIIENYRELRAQLPEDIVCTSDTDSEVFAHLIGQYYDGDLQGAVNAALEQVRGTYGIVVMHADEPETLVAARMGSPLVIGVGEGEYFLASDATPMIAYTQQVIFLDDGEIATIKNGQLSLATRERQQVQKQVEHIEWNVEQAQKRGYDHFMLKEIHEQPAVFEDAIRGRYNLDEGTAHLGGLHMSPAEMRNVKRIVLLACGTSSYAAMVGKYAFERLAGIPTDVEIASEFRYRDPIVDEHTLVFALSQSGETADTLAALREAKRKGGIVRGIVNVVGSTIARETDGGSYIHAGPELSVASTKAYTNMIAILFLYALEFGRLHRVTLATGQRLLKALLEIPDKMQQILDRSDDIRAVAEQFAHREHFFFLGRGINYPVALEGSLKLKEVSYIHSEAYPGGELKHGPLALLSPDFPVFAIMVKDQLYEKMRSNVEEIKARHAPVVLLATDGDAQARELSEHVIYTPDTMELLEPILNTIPLQLFSYYASVSLGRDVDRPRHLAKSVTVE